MENEALRSINASDKVRYEEKNKELEEKNKVLEEKLQSALLSQDNILTTLTKNLTKAQIDRLLYNKNTNWSPQDYATGVVLLGVSKKFYHYLRTHTKFLLPCITSVKKFVSSIDFEPGLLTNALTLLEYTGKSLSDIDRLVMLSYDEMHLDETCGYDSKWDQVLGPCRQVQVIHARGIYGKWKVPVYYEFDVPVTKDLLDKVVTALHNIDFTVVGVVSDMASTNDTLFKKMGVTIEKPFFTHIVTQDPIFCFHDLPHMIKLCRNHLLDKGIFLSPTEFASKDALQELVEKSAGIDLLPHKMTLAHLSVKGSDRQNVLKANQVLSNSTSRALIEGSKQGYLKSKNSEVIIFRKYKVKQI